MSALKNTAYTLSLFSIPGGVVFWTSGVNSDLVVFNFDGSSSMRPIIETLMQHYRSENSGQSLSANVSTIGSSTGLNRLINKHSEFALVSHDISDDAKGSLKSFWDSRKLKTVTLAKEAILVLYKPPKNCYQDLIISKDNIKQLYSHFSGHFFDNQVSSNFKDLFKDKPEECSANIKVWVKSVGPTKSGTAKAFVNNPLLKNFCDNSQNGDQSKCQEWLKKVKGDGYGVDGSLYYTPEPNILHWENFSLNLQPGTLTYLPSHFAFLNWNLIKNAGVKVARIKFDDSSASTSSTTPSLSRSRRSATAFRKQVAATVTDGSKIKLVSYTPDPDSKEINVTQYKDQMKDYKWGRTFNLIYSVDDLDQKKKDMLKGILEKTSVLENLKLIPFKYKIKNDSSSSSSGTPAEGTKEIELEKPDKDTNEYGTTLESESSTSTKRSG